MTRTIEGIDPVAAVFASRRADDRYFCWEEPGRGLSIGGLGAVHEVVSRGSGRVADLVSDTTAFAATPPGG